MASEDDRSHRRNNTLPHSIPLQNLPRHPELDESPTTHASHRRTLSERGRRLLTRDGTRRQAGGILRANYTAVNDSPVSSRPARLAAWQPDPENDRGARSQELVDDDDGDIAGERSPLADRYAFSTGTVGLELGLDEPMGFSALPRRREDNLLGRRESLESFPDLHMEDDEGPYGMPPLEEDRDTTPLTDKRYLQPMGMATPSTPSGHRHDRSRTLSVRFSFAQSSSPSARLGDELAAAEEGLRPSIRTRGSSESRMGSVSPSPSGSSPLHRAGTIVREMGQRIVNLSNEPEVVQRNTPRRNTLQSRKSNQSDEPEEDSGEADPTLDGSRSQIDTSFTRPVHHPTHEDWVKHANPFRGSSLGIFPPDSPIRTWLCDLLVSPVIEPLILLLILIQTVLLAVDGASNILDHPEENQSGPRWISLALVAIFVIYSIEVIIRIIVSGFVFNAVEYSTIDRGHGIWKGLTTWSRALFALASEQPSEQRKSSISEAPHASVIRTLAVASFQGDVRHKQRVRLAYRAFLRHGFNRVDFLAVVAFWISFSLSLYHVESNKHIYAFRMLSSLRIMRLLDLTKGTTIILRSLKRAAPLLLNVALLIGFFWLLFAIVGVQSFKSSLRRYCVWYDPLNETNTYTLNASGNFQFCGGSLTASGERCPWYYADGTTLNVRKGYLCPPGSKCISTDNPYNGTVSFDNIFQSLELVFVLMTSNTYTDLMYYLSDSDYLIACLFFAAGVVIMTLWLINLLIAVITSSFQVMREENQRSAFADQPAETEEAVESTPPDRKSALHEWYDRTFWLWIVIIICGLVCQCLRSASMGPSRARFISVFETIVTFTLLVDIALRFAVDWRHFFSSKVNCIDLFLAVATAVIQIPRIHDSGQPYAWLTIFQIVRIYRVVLAVPWTRVLVLLVLGNMSGLLNLILFVLLLTFLAAIFASQLFRGTVPQYDNSGNIIHVTFATIFNSWIGMYQVLSSENWTILLYNVQTYNVSSNTAWIGAIFFILWFILAFFIVLNMFIAVIQENFDVSEDAKRLEQVKAFLERKEIGGSSHGTLSLSSLFRPGRIGTRRQDPLDYGPAMMDQLLKEAVVQDFVGDSIETPQDGSATPTEAADLLRKETRPVSVLVHGGPFGAIRSFLDKFIGAQEPNPFYSRFRFSRTTYGAINPRTMAREVVTAAEQRKRAQRDYLVRHPKYNVSLYLFPPGNPIRRFCQKLVGPGRGHGRIEGLAPSTAWWYAVSALLYAIIVAMVLLACITTPVYQKDYFATREYTARNWFVFVDLGFAAVFTIEAAVRVIADGFFFAPHAYFRSSWGLIDGIVLVTLWINVLAALLNQGAVSRAVGAFKALRALRLLNVSDTARDTFHAVIVRGGWKVLSAAFVSLSLLIPFAIYGLNLFNGQLESCNDTSSGITNLTDCVNEYGSTPWNWTVVAPRQVANPWYNFDNFGNSLFILFQIVSQEGWTDVMWGAESITGVFTQPKAYSRQGNAIFFIVFNLLGAVFVLTLFISVFMRNYTEQTGVAFLTAEQRSWMELRNRLRLIAPSKRPSYSKKRHWLTKKCYHFAVTKTGGWQRFVTVVLVFHLILLCLEFYPVNQTWETIRTYMFLALTIFYLINIVVRIVGLTWTRFRKSAWDVYSMIVVTGTLLITILGLLKTGQVGSDRAHTVLIQLHKLFLVSIVMLLIPRNNQLDQLFKTAAASLTAIGNLLATWVVLFLVFAIAFTQTFGLTRFGAQESGNINFRNVPKALLLLFRMSTGEGWNQVMEDYANIVPPLCTQSANFLDSDCGSREWARALFISWNILSMYIFVNMFISLIFESFSYVYQRSSGLALVTRSELRRFKQAWAELDQEGTGYIQKESLSKLLSELSGVFEMRIYPSEFSVHAIINDCKKETRPSSLPIMDDTSKPAEIDLEKLNARLAEMPTDEIRRRRREMNVFTQEIVRSINPDLGIGFTQVLMVLAHYKIIKDNKSLRLEEFLRRKARLQMVEDDVRRAIVASFLDTVHWKRRFRRVMSQRKSARLTTIPQLQVPEIYIEDEDEDEQKRDTQPNTRPNLSISIPSLESSTHASGISPREDSPGNMLRNRADSFNMPSPLDGSPIRRNISPQHSPQLRGRASDVSADSRLGAGPYHGWESGPPTPMELNDGSVGGRRPSDMSERSRAGSSVLQVLDDSVWGESLRRSMTKRRRESGAGHEK